MRRVLVVLAAAMILAAAFLLRGSPQDDALRNETRTEESTGGSGAEGGLAEESGRISPAPLPRLVDLGSDRCIPCKQMAPILEELKSDYRGVFQVEFIDVWKNPDSGQPYGIRVIPTQIFLDASGKERFRHEGFFAKEAILEKWRELGVDLGPASVPPSPEG